MPKPWPNQPLSGNVEAVEKPPFALAGATRAGA